VSPVARSRNDHTQRALFEWSMFHQIWTIGVWLFWICYIRLVQVCLG
jgi:hypothetical protein